MEMVVRNVKDLEKSKRRLCEELLGHALSENQQLVIQVFTHGIEPTAEERDRALDRLKHLMANARGESGVNGPSDHEVGQIIDDAIAAVRAGRT